MKISRQIPGDLKNIQNTMTFYMGVQIDVSKKSSLKNVIKRIVHLNLSVPIPGHILNSFMTQKLT